MKGTKLLTLDLTTKRWIEDNHDIIFNGNFSGWVNQIVINIQNIHENENTMTITKLRTEVNRLENQKNKILTELSIKKHILRDLEFKESEKIKNEEERIIQLEKERQERELKCINCKAILDEKSKKFNQGSVCYFCYRNMTNEQFNQWSKEVSE